MRFIYYLFPFVQSPTESLNSDSRPESLDEQDNTNEPPETTAAEVAESKESEEKPADAAAEVNNAESGSGAVTDENVSAATASTSRKDGTVESTNENDSKETKPILSDESAADGKTKTEATASSPKHEADAPASAKLDDSKADKSIESTAATAKEQEIISTVANIKKECNTSSSAAATAPPAVASVPDAKEPLYIKKEPRDESMETANSNSNEPHDLKLAADIKSENKCGLDLTDHEHKQEATAKAAFDLQHKFGNGPTPADAHAFSAGKYSESSPKFPQDVPLKYSPSSAPPTSESGPKGDAASTAKPYGDAEVGLPLMKPYPIPPTPNDNKYANAEAAAPNNKYANVSAPSAEQQIKYENNESPLSKRPTYAEPLQTLRSPYETTAMMKYSEAMQKYPGALAPPIASIAAQDLKYVSPADMKYRIPENLSKSQFSADNLMKANSIYGEYTSSAAAAAAGKYPPTESPIDASARSTPTQDSQGSSNSNLPPQMAHNSSLPSPHPNLSQHANQVPSHLMPGAIPMLMGPVGFQAHHLPPGHPSSMVRHSGPQPPPPPTSKMQVDSDMSCKMPGNYDDKQPLNLLGAPNPNQILPPSSALHRPHQDLPPPSLHHSAAFSAGILPPPPHSISNQSPSPALSVSRAEHERNEQQRRMESLHHRASPSLLPPGATMLGHPSMPLHLQPGMSAAGIPMLPPHHSGHLGPPLLPPSMPGSAIALMGGPPPSMDGRRSPPTSAPTSSAPALPGQSNASQTSSAFSRTSPSVQFSHPSAHRATSPSQPPSNLTRGSPLHLSHHSSSSALSAAAVAAAERDRQALMRQQSPHMTPPPPASSILSSPLNKMYGQQPPPPPSSSTSQANVPVSQQQSHTPQPRSLAASPPHHLRPGTSPPVIRHPQMPLALPLIGQPGAMPSPMGMHPHNPYSHHLIHPMFAYSHQHNPFNSPYPYHPYSPGFQYMKPPSSAGLEPGGMPPHHPGQVPSRCEEPPSHPGDKNAQNAMQHKNKPPTPKTPQGGGGGGSSCSTPSASFSSPHAQYASPHAYGDSPIAGKTSHMDALRAHAHSASSGLGSHHSAEPMHVEIEPDSEPEIPSPTHNLLRGPSPEAKSDDTECHRSPSAM